LWSDRSKGLMIVAVYLSLGLFVSFSCGRRELGRINAAEWRRFRRTSQTGRAVEQRRPQACPLSLCRLRMKREDFITNTGHASTPLVSLLPSHPNAPSPFHPFTPPRLPPGFPSTLPGSSTLQGMP
ncbi:hypothetical protein XENOCAPTIV_030213, partial [Xenoophorus captivus]